MHITRWHYGKLIILWTWGASLTAFAFHLLAKSGPIIGTVLLAIVGGIPAVLSILTWKWLSGKDRNPD